MKKTGKCPICGKEGYEPRPLWQALFLTALAMGLIMGILGIIEIATR